MRNRRFDATDTANIRAAEAKRERRRLRNIDNEAAQGRYPEEAECGCGKWGPINYDGSAYYCGGSERCCP
jgi:hypothetical protein